MLLFQARVALSLAVVAFAVAVQGDVAHQNDLFSDPWGNGLSFSSSSSSSPSCNSLFSSSDSCNLSSSLQTTTSTAFPHRSSLPTFDFLRGEKGREMGFGYHPSAEDYENFEFASRFSSSREGEKLTLSATGRVLFVALFLVAISRSSSSSSLPSTREKYGKYSVFSFSLPRVNVWRFTRMAFVTSLFLSGAAASRLGPDSFPAVEALGETSAELKRRSEVDLRIGGGRKAFVKGPLGRDIIVSVWNALLGSKVVRVLLRIMVSIGIGWVADALGVGNYVFFAQLAVQWVKAGKGRRGSQGMNWSQCVVVVVGMWLFFGVDSICCMTDSAPLKEGHVILKEMHVANLGLLAFEDPSEKLAKSNKNLCEVATQVDFGVCIRFSHPFVYLVGPSGGGKSSLMMVLAKLLKLFDCTWDVLSLQGNGAYVGLPGDMKLVMDDLETTDELKQTSMGYKRPMLGRLVFAIGKTNCILQVQGFSLRGNGDSQYSLVHDYNYNNPGSTDNNLKAINYKAIGDFLKSFRYIRQDHKHLYLLEQNHRCGTSSWDAVLNIINERGHIFNTGLDDNSPRNIFVQEFSDVSMVTMKENTQKKKNSPSTLLEYSNNTFKPSQMSGGQRDAVMTLWGLFGCDSETDASVGNGLVLLDEPGQNLGVFERLRLASVIRKAAEKHGLHIIVATHHSEILDKSTLPYGLYYVHVGVHKSTRSSDPFRAPSLEIQSLTKTGNNTKFERLCRQESTAPLYFARKVFLYEGIKDAPCVTAMMRIAYERRFGKADKRAERWRDWTFQHVDGVRFGLGPMLKLMNAFNIEFVCLQDYDTLFEYDSNGVGGHAIIAETNTFLSERGLAFFEWRMMKFRSECTKESFLDFYCDQQSSQPTDTQVRGTDLRKCFLKDLSCATIPGENRKTRNMKAETQTVKKEIKQHLVGLLKDPRKNLEIKIKNLAEVTAWMLACDEFTKLGCSGIEENVVFHMKKATFFAEIAVLPHEVAKSCIHKLLQDTHPWTYLKPSALYRHIVYNVTSTDVHCKCDYDDNQEWLNDNDHGRFWLKNPQRVLEFFAKTSLAHMPSSDKKDAVVGIFTSKLDDAKDTIDKTLLEGWMKMPPSDIVQFIVLALLQLSDSDYNETRYSLACDALNTVVTQDQQLQAAVLKGDKNWNNVSEEQPKLKNLAIAYAVAYISQYTNQCQKESERTDRLNRAVISLENQWSEIASRSFEALTDDLAQFIIWPRNIADIEGSLVDKSGEPVHVSCDDSVTLSTLKVASRNISEMSSLFSSFASTQEDKGSLREHFSFTQLYLFVREKVKNKILKLECFSDDEIYELYEYLIRQQYFPTVAAINYFQKSMELFIT